MISGRVDVGARYAEYDPTRGRANDLQREVAPFLNVYVFGNDLKVQADYTFASTQLEDRRTSTPADPRFTELREQRARVSFILQY